MATVDLNNTDPTSVPVRDAATVIVVRQGGAGIEVCMLQRNLKSDFVGGAYVFPGGAVDPEDSDPRYSEILSEPAKATSDLAGDGLEFRVAVVRESFEEAGILFASDSSGSAVALSDPALKERFRQHRLDVDSGNRLLVDVCIEENLTLDLAQMSYMSRWVTPLGANRRYDTRFFVAVAPPRQQALHDDHEVIDTVWISPHDAIADAKAGRRTMIFPTVRTMVLLSRFGAVDELIEHVGAIDDVPVVEPVMTAVGDRLELRLPGDPENVGGIYDALTGEPLSAS